MHFKDGTATDNVEHAYPLGHRFRREEAFPKIMEKYTANLAGHYAVKQRKKIEEISENHENLSSMKVNEFMDLFINQ